MEYCLGRSVFSLEAVLQIASFHWKWRRLLLFRMVNPSHHAAGTCRSCQHCLDVVLWAPCWCSHEPPPQPWCWPSCNVWGLSVREGSALLQGISWEFPVFLLQLAAFFSDSCLHPRKPLTMCAYINPFCRVWVSVTGSGSPVRQSWAALQPCDVHGHETCVFSDQNSRYPQSSRFPQLSCAKPLKSIVFLLWPCAFDFLR